MDCHLEPAAGFFEGLMVRDGHAYQRGIRAAQLPTSAARRASLADSDVQHPTRPRTRDADERLRRLTRCGPLQNRAYILVGGSRRRRPEATFARTRARCSGESGMRPRPSVEQQAKITEVSTPAARQSRRPRCRPAKGSTDPRGCQVPPPRRKVLQKITEMVQHDDMVTPAGFARSWSRELYGELEAVGR